MTLNYLTFLFTHVRLSVMPTVNTA